MLFKEKLDLLTPEVDAALDELFAAILKNQTHEQDLLLVEINGFFDPKMDEPEMKKRFNFSPFLFGPQGWTYYADYTQYSFYDYYRRRLMNIPRSEFFKDFDSDQEKQAYCDITIQMELMVYLKFWESNRTLKRLYHLAQLAIGKNYDWHFEINQDDSRHKIIRELIREPIKNECPKYYKLIKDIYLSQIRNAAAHSDYYIVGQKLGFCNHDPANHAPLTQINFEEWEDRFHKLILLYNGLIGRFKLAHESYIEEQKGKEFGLQISLTRKDGQTKDGWIKYVEDQDRSDWMWYENWKKHYKNKKCG